MMKLNAEGSTFFIFQLQIWTSMEHDHVSANSIQKLALSKIRLPRNGIFQVNESADFDANDTIWHDMTRYMSLIL